MTRHVSQAPASSSSQPYSVYSYPTSCIALSHPFVYSLGLFNGKAVCNWKTWVISTPNQDTIPTPSWEKRKVCLLADLWYGLDNHTLWSQGFVPMYPHLTAIPCKSKDPNHPCLTSCHSTTLLLRVSANFHPLIIKLCLTANVKLTPVLIPIWRRRRSQLISFWTCFKFWGTPDTASALSRCLSSKCHLMSWNTRGI